MLRKLQLNLAKIAEPDIEPQRIPTPELQLLAAVIERAILDLRGIDISATKEARAAMCWIFALDADETKPPQPFSFSWICIELGIEPAKARQLAQEIYDGTKQISGFRGHRRVPRPHGLLFTPKTKEQIASEINAKVLARSEAELKSRHEIQKSAQGSKPRYDC